MNSLKTKLALSAIVVAALATPAFAQGHHSRRALQDYAGGAIVQQSEPTHYPNGAARTGSAESVQSGAMFNQGY
ncbi:MAG TPA: hypothetical protein VHY10_19900 [Xanthobacteraceae bacterium]|jgi:hypothetical protein|nr:hypothetical protein [Xanthobacteraceae bacterium]